MPHMQSDVLQNVDLVSYLHDLVCEHPDFEVLSEPTADLYCFRYRPNGLQDDQREVERFVDRINEDIVEKVRREGFEWITKRHVNKRIAICLWISNRTTREDVEAMFEAVARLGRLRSRKQISSAIQLMRDMELIQC